jgi:hypothetical protein
MSVLCQRLERAVINYLRTSALDDGGLLKKETGELIVTDAGFRIRIARGADFRELDVNLYVGEWDEEVKIPAVIAIAETGIEDESDWGTGNLASDLAVELRFPADDYAAEPDVIAALLELSAALMDRLWIAELADILSRHETDFTCQGVISRQAARVTDGRVRIHRYGLQLYCCPSDLALS